MFAWLRRQRLRPLLPRLLDDGLPQQQAADLWRRIDSDPVLQREALRLTNALGCFRDWPEQQPPASYAADLCAALEAESDPLRSRLSDYHDGALPSGEYELVRQALSAAPQVADEYRLMAAAVKTLKTLPEVPVPADFRRRLDRELDRLDDARSLRRPAPRRALVLRLAVAAAVLAAVVGVGLRAGRVVPSGETVGYIARQPAGPTDETPVLEPVTAGEPRPVEQPVVVPGPAPEPAPVRTAKDLSRPVAELVAERAVSRPAGRRLRVVHAAYRYRPPRVSRPLAPAPQPVVQPEPVKPKVVAPGRLSAAAVARRAREEAAALAAVEKTWQSSTNALAPAPEPRATMLVVMAPREPAGEPPARPQIPDPSQLNTPQPAPSGSILFERPQAEPELPLPLDFE